MKEINVELYKLMQDNEVHIMINEIGRIEMWLHLNFCQCKDFVKAVGIMRFDEGGIECLFQEAGICVLNLQDIIWDAGHEISSYKSVIDDWENWGNEVLKIESEEK